MQRNMIFRGFRVALVPVLAVAMLAGCSRARTPETSEYNEGPAGGPVQPGGGILGDSSFTLFGGRRGGTGGDQGGPGLAVNAYLWRGALDTLSFMPLASADPFGGVIITDWYQPAGGNGERFKATAYILGRQLRSDAIRVSLFRQVARNGVWVDADVSSQTSTDIENKVLARARELRAAANASR